MFFYVERILVPYQVRDWEIHGRPRGHLSDLYPSWLGSRELLLHGRDPYSAEITREIQTGFYGRPLDPTLPNDPKDEQRFAYPVYVAFLLSPTVGLPFPLARSVFLWGLALMTAASVFLWLSFLQWRPSWVGAAVMVLLTIGNFAVLQGVKLQQLSLLVGFMLAVSSALLVRQRLFLSGLVMALAMIKPQLALPMAGWLLLWAISDWTRRRAWVVGFGSAMAVEIAASELLLPGWVWRFRDTVAVYRTYAARSGVLDLFLSPAGAVVASVLLVVVVVGLCWRARKLEETQPEFQRITSLVLAATVVILPMIVPYNHVLLLPAIFLLARDWARLKDYSWITRGLATVAVVLIAWPWIAASVLTVLSGFVRAEAVQ